MSGFTSGLWIPILARGVADRRRDLSSVRSCIFGKDRGVPQFAERP